MLSLASWKVRWETWSEEPWGVEREFTRETSQGKKSEKATELSSDFQQGKLSPSPREYRAEESTGSIRKPTQKAQFLSSGVTVKEKQYISVGVPGNHLRKGVRRHILGRQTASPRGLHTISVELHFHFRGICNWHGFVSLNM